jgi:hypothetical protein
LRLVLGLHHHGPHQGFSIRSVLCYGTDAPLYHAASTRVDFGPSYQVSKFVGRQNIALLRRCLDASQIRGCHDFFVTKGRPVACFHLGNLFGHMAGESSKVLEIGALVPQLYEIFFAHDIVGERLVLRNAKADSSSSTSSSNVIVGGGLFLLGGGESIRRHGRGGGRIVLFAALAPVGLGDLQQHGGKKSAGDDGHIDVCLLLLVIVSRK